MSVKKIKLIFFIFSLFIIILFFYNSISFVSAATEISSCTTITSPGEYTLTADIINSSASICIDIQANDVTLDCQGYTIDGKDTSNTYGIRVYRSSSTDTNVIIKNCILTDWFGGIYLYRANNNTIINSTSNSNSQYGIYLSSSSNNTIINSIFNSNYYGIYLTSSSNNNTIINSTANSNSQYGIYLASSSNNNQIINSTFNSNSQYGIFLYSSSNNTIINSIFNSNYYGIYLSSSSNNQIINSSLINNIVYDLYLYSSQDSYCQNKLENVIGTDNKPIIYYNETVNIQGWNNNFSELILCNADYSVIKNVNLTHINKKNNGILLVRTDYSNLTNIFVNNSYYGIYLYSSSNNTIINSIFNSNSYGIYLYSSSNNQIINSTANLNSRGIYLYSSSNNTVVNNIIKENNNFDIYIYASKNEDCNNILENNIGSMDRTIKYFNNSINLSNEVLSELILCNADYSVITNITIEASQIKKNNGLIAFLTDNSNFININSSNNWYGIYLSGSNNTIMNNIANSNSDIGILLGGSNNTIMNNIANSNSYGIRISGSNNTIMNNIANNNSGGFGFDLPSLSNSILVNNTANSNNNGIYLDSSSNNQIINSTANLNFRGISLSSSSNNNTLHSNTITKNTQYGIYLSSPDSTPNTIYNNFFNNTNNFYFIGTPRANNWNTTKTSGTNIIGGNYLGGNFWAKPDGTGYSETCSDSDSDGICDSAYILASNNIDYLPLAIYSSIGITPFQLTIISPANITYNTNTISFNITANKALSSCKYTLNNWQTNITMTKLNDTYFYNITQLNDGSYTARFWCNDTASNVNNTEQVSFVVNTTQPEFGCNVNENHPYDYNDDKILNGTDITFLFLLYPPYELDNCPIGKICDLDKDGYMNDSDVLLLIDYIAKGCQSFCGDNICNENIGENYTSCPNDCLKKIPKGIAYWADMNQNYINKTNVNDSVLMIYNIGEEYNGQEINFEVHEVDKGLFDVDCSGDWPNEARYARANVINGKAIALWKARYCSNGESDGVYFIAKLNDTIKNESNILEILQESDSPTYYEIIEPREDLYYYTNEEIRFIQNTHDIDDIIEYTWYFGDGNYVSGNTFTYENYNITHNYSSDGKKEVILKIKSRETEYSLKRNIYVIDKSSTKKYAFANIREPKDNNFSSEIVNFSALGSHAILYNSSTNNITCLIGICLSKDMYNKNILDNIKSYDEMRFYWTFDKGLNELQTNGSSGLNFSLYFQPGQHYVELYVEFDDPIQSEKINNQFNVYPSVGYYCSSGGEYWINSSGDSEDSLNDCYRENVLIFSSKTCCPLGYKCISDICKEEHIETCFDYKTKEDCENYSLEIAKNSIHSLFSAQDLGLKCGGFFFNNTNDGIYVNYIQNCKCIWNETSQKCYAKYEQNNKKIFSNENLNNYGNCTIKEESLTECINGRIRYLNINVFWEGNQPRGCNNLNEAIIPCFSEIILPFISWFSVILFLVILLIYYYKKLKKD
ncbi:MAG: NosD domain-containing protein [Candidatus Pacearchaeota archaeon]